MPATILLEDLTKANDDELAQHMEGLFAAPGGGFDPSNIIPRQIPVQPEPAPEPEPAAAPPQELQDHVTTLLSNPPAAAPTPTVTPTPTAAPAQPPTSVVQELADHVSQASGGALKWIGEGITNLQQGAQQATSGLTNLLPPPAPPSPPTTPSMPSAVGPGPVAPGGPLVDYARQAAARAGIDPDIFVRQIQQESGFNPGARSPAGATGIAQFMPGTAAGLGIDPTEPYQALEGAAKLMSNYLRQYDGDYARALAAYNAGPGNVQKYGGVPPFEETQRYVSTILSGQRPTPAPAQGLERVGAAIEGANRVDSSGHTFPLIGYKVGSNGNNDPHATYHGVGGSDLMAPRGTPVVAVGGGTVVQIMTENPNAPGSTIGGNAVQIRGDDGLDYYYAHLDGAPRVEQGQRVSAGDMLGAVGNTGNAWKGGKGETHLHLGIGRGISTGQGAEGGLGQNFDAQAFLSNLIPTSGQAPPDQPRVSPHDVQGQPSQAAAPAAPAARQGIQFLGDEGQTAAGFTAPGGPAGGFLEQAGQGIQGLGQAAGQGLQILGNAINPTPTNPTAAAVPGGGYEVPRAPPPSPGEGIPLRQDVRDLNQPAQPTVFEQPELVPRILRGPLLTTDQELLQEATPSQRDQARRFAKLGHPREPDYQPTDAEIADQLRNMNIGIAYAGTHTGAGRVPEPAGRGVDLDALAEMRAEARRQATAPPPPPPPGSPQREDWLLGRGKWAEPEPPQASNLEKVMTVGVNNMLGGTTSFVNNALSGVAENLYRPAATAIVRGELGPAWQDVRAQAAAIGDALSDMASTFVTGERPSRIGGADYPEAFPGKAGMLPFTSGNLRANAAMDEFNRALATAGGQAAELARLARDNPNLSQAELITKYRDQLAEVGTNAAKQATFEAGGTPIGDALAAARRKFTSPDATMAERAAGLLAQLVVPFSKIPDSILTRGVLGLPVAAEARAAVNIARAARAGDKAAVGRSIRQLALTEAVNAGIAWQVLQGNITGNGPNDPARRAARENARDADGNPIWQKNSIRVPTPFGVRWIPYSSLGPIAVRLGGIANFVEQMDDADGKVDANVLKEASAALGDTITDAWYLQTAGRIFQAMKTGKILDVAGKTLLDFGERYVPDSALANQLRQFTDPTVREPTNPLEDVANRIPGLSQLVPSKINPATGEPLERPRDVVSAVTRSSAPGTPDPVNEALALHNLGVADPPPTITQRKFTIDINDAEQRQYSIEAGRAVSENVRKIIDDPDYRTWSYEDQRAALSKAISDARADAAAAVWSNLSGDELDRRVEAYEERKRRAEEPGFRSPALAR